MAARPISTIKELVSKRRKRYTQDGFNLDLAYITPNIIAMGFPADKLEGVYRNHIDDVKRFLEEKHINHYKVYNLCSERKYDLSRFEHVGRYPFDDHNPPKIQLIKDFCDDVHKWLSADENNVAAVHCKAGKGRTGTMICCYLLYSRQFKTAAEALNHYAQTRTHDEKGVTIPSQRRYVEYYSYLLKTGKIYNPIALQICEIKLSPPPLKYSHQEPISYSISTTNGKKHCAQGPQFKKHDSCVSVRLDVCIPLDGDIKVEFFWNSRLRKEKLFHFWINTFFVDELAEVLPDGSLSYKLQKHELDDAHKDKLHKSYTKDFQVEVIMQKIPCGPFAKPRSNVTSTENNTNQNNCNNSNHNILTNNGQSLYHHLPMYRHHHNNHHHRPPAISVGGDTGFDQVDNSNSSSGINLPTSVMTLGPTTTTTTTNSTDMQQIPSETSETSSSSEPSSSSEEWESGEFLDEIFSLFESSRGSCDGKMQAAQLDVKLDVFKISNNNKSSCTSVVDDHDPLNLDCSEKSEKKQETSHYSNDDNYYLGSSVSLVASAISDQTISASPPTKILTQRKKFKAKSGLTSTSASTVSLGGNKRIRWLTNMKSDPDFRETLNKNVHFRATASTTTTGLSPVRTSNDSLNSDYYSSICDKQLSFGSPAKSPSEFMRVRTRSRTECPDIVVACKKKTPIIPYFCTPPPNTPTTPGPPIDTDTDARKSPARFFTKFYSNFKRDHDINDTGHKAELTGIPEIKINDATTTTKASSNSKFSFRDLRNEIQSAIKMHHQHNHAPNNPNNSNNSNNSDDKGSSDNKKSKKIE